MIIVLSVQLTRTTIRAVMGAPSARVHRSTICLVKPPPCALLFVLHPKHLRAGALNVMRHVFINGPVVCAIIAEHTMDPRASDIPDPCFGVVVNQIGNATETEVGREEAAVVLVSKDIDM
jgi:hypothetical protein